MGQPVDGVRQLIGRAEEQRALQLEHADPVPVFLEQDDLFEPPLTVRAHPCGVIQTTDRVLAHTEHESNHGGEHTTRDTLEDADEHHQAGNREDQSHVEQEDPADLPVTENAVEQVEAPAVDHAPRDRNQHAGEHHTGKLAH